MKAVVVTKMLDKDHLEVREFHLFKEPIKVIHCTSADYKSCLHYDDRFMFLSVSQQKKGVVTNTQQSKFYPYSYYRMYKFLWKPYVPKIDDSVSIDPTALAKLPLPKNWEETRKLLHTK